MKTSTKFREMLSTHKELQQKIEKMEKKYDAQFKVVFDAIRALMAPPEPKKKEIGFHVKEKKTKSHLSLSVQCNNYLF